MAVKDEVPLEVENFDGEYRPSVFLQNLELKKSAPGSMQHVAPWELVLVILPVDTAKSYEISSNASSRPRTRVSKDCIPLSDLPINLWTHKG